MSRAFASCCGDNIKVKLPAGRKSNETLSTESHCELLEIQSIKAQTYNLLKGASHMKNLATVKRETCIPQDLLPLVFVNHLYEVLQIPVILLRSISPNLLQSR